MSEESAQVYEEVKRGDNQHGFVLAQPVSVVYGHPVLMPMQDPEVADRTLTEYETYCGPVSCCIACMLLFTFMPAAPCVACCPCDLRRRHS